MLAFSLLAVARAHAQADPGFINHLGKNGLQREHFSYLGQQPPCDSTSYDLARYFLQYPNDSLFFRSFRKSEPLFFADTSAFNIASLHFLSGDHRSRWFDSAVVKAAFVPHTAARAWDIHRSVVAPLDFDIENLPSGLQEDFRLYRRAASRKPLASLAMSAAVPGLGKLYIGNRRSAGITFISLAVLGLQSYESYRKMGLTHPLTVINLGFLATYYTVNLFGSFRETKMKSRELRNQYLMHASTYYRYKYPDQLYR